MSDIDIFLYSALYDLSSGHKQVLLFKKNDTFIPIPNCSTNPNWAVCIDMKGTVGYVPYTYVEKKQVTAQEYLWLIDDALEKLHIDSPSISKLTREVIKNLTFVRTQLLSSNNCKSDKKGDSNEISANSQVCPTAIDSPQEISNSVVNSINSSKSDSSSAITTEVEKTTDDTKTQESAQKCTFQAVAETQTDGINDFDVPNWLVPSLVENVRHKTKISHENSKAAVAIILDTFLDAIPRLDILWLQLKNNLKQSETIEENTKEVIYSEDQTKLLDIFKQLWYCKNDEQQRSWPVHEDEDHIGGLLVEMNNIFLDANPRITREVVRHDEYEMVNLLVTYYQMEPRRTLRIKMLHIFLTICELDVIVVTQLLNSVLPMELARDIQDNFEDSEKVFHSALLLSVIFSTGEKPPTGTYEIPAFLFEKLENVVKDGDEDVGQNLLNIILAFNLHFESAQENIVLETLKEKQSAQYLTEKLIFLLNREEDPCKILTLSKDAANSVMKFMVDMFSFPELIDLFYLNDIKVLLDIIVRQLTDLLPGEQKRFNYLHLVQNLLRNSNYGEHLHQLEGLQNCFKSIISQELPDENEVTLVLEMAYEFKSWFKNI
ncbi:NCK-interacting protein with SH3 domain [Caerostris darwini]|uniref:NCK-interacting protein with SH3 domain n=1 Tax=Caerostris darwini TaxID=1538125 RepID=A0AAV4WE89_9ARAC|nr:NCK-interacting protein with SH3 domain [Caerostris darwini]